MDASVIVSGQSPLRSNPGSLELLPRRTVLTNTRLLRRCAAEAVDESRDGVEPRGVVAAERVNAEMPRRFGASRACTVATVTATPPVSGV